MDKNTSVKYNTLISKKLFIADLKEYLEQDKSKEHVIKAALVCLCKRGKCTVKINYSTHELRQNEALVILPTHMFSIVDCSNDIEVEALIYTDDYWVSISQSINFAILKRAEYFPQIPLTDESRLEIESLLSMIKNHEKNAENSEIEQSVFGGLAYSLLMMIGSLIDKRNSDMPRSVSRKEELTRGFFDLLSVHFETERQVAFYASKLCVTPKHLSMCVKDITNLSILDWINNVTILTIKRRLRTTNDTIQQISEDLNFQTASTFIRYFRQHTGTTPLKFRNCD